MATDLGRAQSTAPSKYDAIVASQLKQAETRIRLLDLAAGLLGFATLSLVYVVGMVLCDSQFLLSQQTRQLSLYVFLAGAAVYLFFTILRPLGMRVNPYYAARQVEQHLPQAKNSIVNWVDLHEQPLPPAIRGALGQRAAKDFARVDLDRAISGRRAAWMGGIAGLFAVAFMASFFLLGPKPFLSLLKRTFNPFEAVGVSTRTRLTLLKPQDGNATITVGRGIGFAVDVGGKVPDPKATDAVKLLFRYEDSDPWLERRLIQERSGEWTASLSAIEVKNGFWYRITGGDAATAEYRVGVRAAPAITDFLATYRFRTYAACNDEIRRGRELKALRGTEILLAVRTNRALRDGRMELESNGRAGAVNPSVISVRAEIDANDPHTFHTRFILNEDGKYRLGFTSTDGEVYRDAVSYPVIAIPDRPPTVELTKPGKDIHLPADALLHLEGKAGDDIGVKSLLLQMRLIGGDKLRGQPYRSDEQLRLADGGYPRELEYKDFVELARVKNESGQEVALRSGMELEYWLEASDACDYPQANIAESKHYRVLLTDPEKKDPKKKQDKDRAEKEKKQHEQKQDQKLKKENQERQQQRQEQQARNKEEESKSQSGSEGGKGNEESNKSQSASEGDKGSEEPNKSQSPSERGKGSGSKKSEPKEGEQKGEGENKQPNGQQQQSKAGKGEANNAEQKGDQSKEDRSIEDRIKKALAKNEGDAKGKGENKEDKSESGQGKGEQQNKSDRGDASKGKDETAGQQGSKQYSDSKGKGKPQSGTDSSQGNKSDSANSDPKDHGSAGQPGKRKGEPKNTPKHGKDSSSSDSQGAKDTAQDDSQPKGEGGDPSKGDAKSRKGEGQQSKDERDRKDAGKSEERNAARGDKKPNGPSSARKATPKDVEDLARALNSKDSQEREKAKQQLQRLAKEAADAKTREKAGEALDKKGEPDGASGKQSPKKGDDSSDKGKDEDKEKMKGSDSEDTGASGEKEASKDSGARPKDGQGDRTRKGASSREELPPPQQSQPGNTPGGGGDNQAGRDSTIPPQLKQPSKPGDHRAAQMQLEDFAKKVDKNILKEAGVSEEAWKKYLEARRKQLAQPEKSRPEVPSAPRQSRQLPSMGGRTIQPAASEQGDAHGPDRGQPPPGYRDAFRKFTRQMSKDK